VGRCQLESGLLILLLAGSEEHEQEQPAGGGEPANGCAEPTG
jgi:hypothetical protein